MELVTEEKNRGSKRKATRPGGQSTKKARYTEDYLAEDPLLEEKNHSSNSISATDYALANSQSDNSDYTESGSDSSVTVDTPLTLFSPASTPRFPSELKTHLCTYAGCGKAFNRPAKVAQHIRSHTNSRPFICPYTPCTKDFLRQSHLKHHIKSVHSNVRDYVCEWKGCGKGFVTATRLKRHHAAHEGRKNFICNFDGCGQAFRKHATLQKHITTVHELKKAFQCELQNEDGSICGQGFNTSGQLRAHKGRIHEGKRFWCSICSSNATVVQNTIGEPLDEVTAGFSTYSSLQEHIKIEHPPQCDICGLACNSQRDLKNHVEVQHGKLSVDERKTHRCPEPGCGRAFTKKGNLNAHIQSAHKAKRYICGEVELESLNNVAGWDGFEACGRALSTKGSLENHIRTIHMGLGRRRSKSKEKSTTEPVQGHGKHTWNLLKLTGVGYEEYSGRHFSCLIPECGFRFGRNYDLQVHLVSRHHLPEGEAAALIASRPTDGHDGCPNSSRGDVEAKDWTMMDPNGSGTIDEEDIPYGGRFWLSNRTDGIHEHDDHDSFNSECEMQKLTNSDALGDQAALMIDPHLQ